MEQLREENAAYLQEMKNIKHEIIDYLLYHYDKLAIQEWNDLSGDELYIKIYSSEDNEVILERLERDFKGQKISFEVSTQEPAFIDDNIKGLEIMITYNHNTLIERENKLLENEKSEKLNGKHRFIGDNISKITFNPNTNQLTLFHRYFDEDEAEFSDFLSTIDITKFDVFFNNTIDEKLRIEVSKMNLSEFLSKLDNDEQCKLEKYLTIEKLAQQNKTNTKGINLFENKNKASKKVIVICNAFYDFSQYCEIQIGIEGELQEDYDWGTIRVL
jgi:hypothetical protein